MKPVLLALLAMGLSTAASAEDLFVVCDNGLRCVRMPCPARDVVALPSGTRYARTSPRFEGFSREDRERLARDDGLYDATIVLGGTIETEPPVSIVARRIVRPARPAEAALCRPRPMR
jgi:hypothetical protein